MGSSCPSRGQRRERRVTVLREESPGHHRRLSGRETDYTASRGPGDSCVTALSSGCGRWPWWWSERPSRQPLDSGDASRPLPEAPAPPSPTGVSRPGRGPGAVPGAGTARERDGHAPAFSGGPRAGAGGRTDGAGGREAAGRAWEASRPVSEGAPAGTGGQRAAGASPSRGPGGGVGRGLQGGHRLAGHRRSLLPHLRHSTRTRSRERQGRDGGRGSAPARRAVSASPQACSRPFGRGLAHVHVWKTPVIPANTPRAPPRARSRRRALPTN